MKLLGAIGTAVLSLTIGATTPVYAQQEQHDQQQDQKAKPAHQDDKPAQTQKPARQAEKSAAPEQNTAKQEKPSAQLQKTAKQEKPSPQRQKNSIHQAENAQQQQQRPHQATPSTQLAQRAGNSGGGRIPDDRFRAHFGRDHTFRVSQGDYSGRRFQYGGYSFGFVDPWPTNWLYTQDVFVVEIGGMYYLCNPAYPGVNVALSVTL